MSATPAQMGEWIGHLSEIGYEALLPSTVTASAEQVEACLPQLEGHAMIAGFHLEGPFISPVYPGAQPKEHILTFDQLDGRWTAILEHPRLRQITLAPELPGALPWIERLSERGVIVSMGHTNATRAEARAGFEAGASQATHTYNAMRPFHHREIGMVGFALEEDRLRTELIYDRTHVSPDAARFLLRCKPPEAIVAVSDATMAAGMAPGQDIVMWGHPSHVGDHEVRLTDGTLAGSAITLFDAFQNIARDFGFETAVRSTSLNPRRALGMDGPPRVWLELDPDFNLVRVWRTTRG